MSLWHEIGVRAQPHFSRGTGMVDLTDLANACPLGPDKLVESQQTQTNGGDHVIYIVYIKSAVMAQKRQASIGKHGTPGPKGVS